MYIGLGGLEGQVLLELLTPFSVIRMPSMHQISSKFWKGLTSEYPLKFVIWPHVVVAVVGWEGSDVGVLVVVMGVAADEMIQVMVEGMGEEVDGDFHLPLLAGQKKAEVVGMISSHETGTWDIFVVDAFKFII